MVRSKNTPNVILDNLAGGLATGDPSLISPTQLSCVRNMDYTPYGGIHSRTHFSKLVGDSSPHTGAVMGIIEYCIPDNCSLGAEGVIPKYSGVRLLIKSVANLQTGNTDLYYLNPVEQKWVKMQNDMRGQHPHDFVIHNNRVYYSNGIDTLKYLCISPVEVEENGEIKCEFNIVQNDPTCATEYSDVSKAVDINLNSKTIIIQNGLFGVVSTVLDSWSPDSNATLCIKVPDLSTESELDFLEFEVEIESVVGNIIKFNNVINGDVVPGLFQSSLLELIYKENGETTEVPLDFCNGNPDLELAGNVKGHILSIHEGRLFVSGDLDYPDLTYVSTASAPLYNESGITPHVGDFYALGDNSRPNYPTTLNYGAQCGRVTAHTVQNGLLNIHHVSDTKNEIFALQPVTDPLGNATYRPVAYNSGTGVNWFRNVHTYNNIQNYINSSNGLPEASQYGLFTGEVSNRVQNISARIKKFMQDVDFDNGAVVSYDNKIFFSGRGLLDCGDDNHRIDSCGREIQTVVKSNDVLLVYDLETQAYTVWNDFYINSFMVKRNKLFYTSSIDGNIYELSENNHKDNLGDILVQPSGFAYFSSLDFDLPGQEKSINSIYVEGKVSTDAIFEVGIIVDCKEERSYRVESSDITCENVCTYGGICSENGCTSCSGEFIRFNGYLLLDENDAGIRFNSIQPFIRYTGGYIELTKLAFRVLAVGSAEHLDEMQKCCLINIVKRCNKNE